MGLEGREGRVCGDVLRDSGGNWGEGTQIYGGARHFMVVHGKLILVHKILWWYTANNDNVWQIDIGLHQIK